MNRLLNLKINDDKKGYFMESLSDLIKNIISISEFSRGKASEIIQRVKNEKAHYVIVKNNKPEAIIMSIEEFSETADKLKEYADLKNKILDKYLLDVAEERMENFESSKLISSDEIISKYNLDKDRINEISKFIEIE